MAISYQFLNGSLKAQCLAFLRSFFGANYFGAEERYFDWQYRDSPFARAVVEKGEYSMMLALEKDTLKAIDGVLPWMTRINGQQHLTFWDLEWLSTGDVPGLGREVVKEARSRCRVYCGYGLNSLSQKAYEKLGFSTSPGIERMVAILDPEACLRLFSPEASAEERSFYLKNACPSMDRSFALLTRMEGVPDRIFADALADVPAASHRGPDFFTWRYLNHPHLAYTILSDGKDCGAGLAAVRLERVRGQAVDVMRVMDLLPAPGREEALVQAVLAFGRERGAILADFFCVSSRVASRLCPAPFLPRAVHEPYDIPRLFQPTERRSRKSINMVLDCDPEVGPVGFEDLYATKAEGDQDVYVNPDYRTVSL